MKRGVLAGSVLILFGIYILLSQLFHIPEGLGLVFLGAFFLVLRFSLKRLYGFTIAGCLVMAVGLSNVLESLGVLNAYHLGFLSGSITLFLLAIAFFTIHILEHPRIGNWPIIPGVCLLIIGGIALISEIPGLYLRLSNLAWLIVPLVLICSGAAMLLSGMRRRAGRGDGWAPPPPQPGPQGEPPRDEAPPDGPQGGQNGNGQ